MSPDRLTHLAREAYEIVRVNAGALRAVSFEDCPSATQEAWKAAVGYVVSAVMKEGRSPSPAIQSPEHQPAPNPGAEGVPI